MDERELAQTLEDLEGAGWGPPEYDSHLVREAHRLRTVPIGELTTENLRLLLGQQIGTPWLMPLALSRLADDPLAMGDYYPGDLLTSVLGADRSYWSSHPDDLLTLWDVKTALEELRGTTDRLLADERWPPFG